MTAPGYPARCEVCGDIALSTDELCGKCVAWSAYGAAIHGRGNPEVFAAGVRRFRRYRRAMQPDPMWMALRRLQRQIAGLEIALGWQVSRFADLHTAANTDEDLAV